MEYTFSKALENDYPELFKLIKEFATFENLEHLMVNSVGQMLKEKELFNCFIVRDKNNIIMGYATYFYAYYTWSGKSVYMDDLYIKEEQ